MLKVNRKPFLAPIQEIKLGCRTGTSCRLTVDKEKTSTPGIRFGYNDRWIFTNYADAINFANAILELCDQ